MEQLGEYTLYENLSSQNSGYSIWGFGYKNNKDYFIKQFLSPKYPADDYESSPQRLAKKKAQCIEFERKKISVYSALNSGSDGNAVHVTEFFRIDTKYYISMPKIEALPVTIGEIAAMPVCEKCRLCAIIAHAVYSLHLGGLIHADLKHENILFTQTRQELLTAKVIDFDSSFLESEPPGEDEDIVGDLVYFSPEAVYRILGEAKKLTCKMDVFSLGVLFHQYLTGELPSFDHDYADYPGEAAARGLIVEASEDIPAFLNSVFSRMLSVDPDVRPSAFEVYNTLISYSADASGITADLLNLDDAKYRASSEQDFFSPETQHLSPKMADSRES